MNDKICQCVQSMMKEQWEVKMLSNKIFRIIGHSVDE